MRLLIWVIALFALAVGLTAAARYNTGYVLFALPGYRIELSVNLAAILLLLSFLLFYAVLRSVLLALAMPRRAGEYRRTQERLRARKVLEDGLRAFLEGRFGRAERGAAQAASAGEWPAISLAVAARSAHELRNFSGRDAYLDQMGGSGPSSPQMLGYENDFMSAMDARQRATRPRPGLMPDLTADADNQLAQAKQNLWNQGSADAFTSADRKPRSPCARPDGASRTASTRSPSTRFARSGRTVEVHSSEARRAESKG